MMYGWQNSSGHNASMLSRDFNYVGIGVAENGSVAYFTTIFLLQRDHRDRLTPGQLRRLAATGPD
jgi:hypothetical protein